ncbi:gliding motility-associated C-terminal domain-containing protein [Saprospiraceae bacterium]|nr:gliding motility-associated C-terminal domain-containing protein [Saprospiraceae bacterium]
MGYRFSINNSSLFPIDSCVQVFAGEYLISIFDSEGCSTDTTIIVTQPSELLASLGDEILFELGDSTEQLTVQLNQSFIVDTIIWSSTQPYECVDEDCESIFIYPDADVIYTVTAVDINGCTATDQVLVRIDDERKVYFPNIFTPDGDGINDVFQLYTGEGVTGVDIFQVYDRWGNKLYEVEDLTPNPAGTIGWDGTFKGQNLDPGVYAYRALITFIDGKSIPYAGSITLIR